MRFWRPAPATSTEYVSEDWLAEIGADEAQVDAVFAALDVLRAGLRENQDLARIGFQQPAYHIDRRGFPGPIGPQITQNLSRRDLKVDPIHGQQDIVEKIGVVRPQRPVAGSRTWIWAMAAPALGICNVGRAPEPVSELSSQTDASVSAGARASR